MVKPAFPPRTPTTRMTDVDRIEARMQDVQLLLDQLLRNEEVTTKLLIDCLYDVGSVNLINQRFRMRAVNQLMRLIAGMSKPVFRIFALRWLRKNCPRLIANWLYRKVSFPVAPTPVQIVERTIAAQTSALATLEANNRQIQTLRYQVRWLTGIIIGMFVLLGGAVVLPNYSPNTGSSSASPAKALHP